MAEQTRLGKVKGMDDKYILITADMQRGALIHTSRAYTEEQARDYLRAQNWSDAEIEAEVANARANEA
jgi:hypothetical protein